MLVYTDTELMGDWEEGFVARTAVALSQFHV